MVGTAVLGFPRIGPDRELKFALERSGAARPRPTSLRVSASKLPPDIAIVAQAALEESESKLRRAGANRVVSPTKESGTEMARLVLHSTVAGAMDVAARYRLEEIAVTPGCAGAGQAVGDVRGGSLIVAVRRADGSFRPQPAAETMLREGDVVMAIGTPQTLTRLERVFDADAGVARGAEPPEREPRLPWKRSRRHLLAEPGERAAVTARPPLQAPGAPRKARRSRG